MNYVSGRDIHDADSHLLEPADWLRQYVDPTIKDRVGLLDLHGLEQEASAALRTQSTSDSLSDYEIRDLMSRKNWSALGAFDGNVRSRVLDRLGFRSQLVFSTYSHLQMIEDDGLSQLDPEMFYGMVDGHNRGIVDFCAADGRLLPVGFIAPQNPDYAIASTSLALELGCAGIELPSLPSGSHSLSHPAYYPIYEMLESRELPLLFHVGGGGRLVHPRYADSGWDSEGLHHERETSMASLTYMGIPAPIEMALAALILDGVLDRFPGLRCGVIEQGAIWVPAFLRRLDAALSEFGRPPQRARLKLKPSEYFRRQVKVTAFPFEDIAWLVKETGADIYLFGTDYPHDEGGETPLELFDAALVSFPKTVHDAIYWRNFEGLMGKGMPDSLRVDRVDVGNSVDDDVLYQTGEPPAVHRKKVLLRLLANEAAARLGITVSETEIQEAIDQFRINCALLEPNETLEWLRRQGITENSLCQVMRDGVLVDKLCEYFGDRIEPELPNQIAVATGRLRHRSKATY